MSAKATSTPPVEFVATARITERSESNGVLKFTLSGVDVSYANAIRRAILSDIPCAVFKTLPYEQSKCIIHANRTSLTNEIIKLQLSCIPICVQTVKEDVLNHYQLEVNVENTTDTLMWVTTRDFKVKNTATGAYLAEEDVRGMFPPFIAPDGKLDFIQFVPLQPKESTTLPGDKLHLTCGFSVDTAKTDGAYNLACTCSYGCTPDVAKMQEELEVRRQKWKDEGKKQEEIDFEAKNWKLLEGLRYIVANSFDFVIETVGVFSNEQLILKACEVVVQRLHALDQKVMDDKIEMEPAKTTMKSAFDIVLPEGHTIGNMLNFELYSRFYLETEALEFVGFKKMHPHDPHGILRVALTDENKGLNAVKEMLRGAIERSIGTLRSLYTAAAGEKKK